MTSEWADIVHDALLQQWPYSTQGGRDRVIILVERLMNGEVIEFENAVPPQVAKTQDEIEVALGIAGRGEIELAQVLLLGIIAHAMTDKPKAKNGGRFLVSAE